MPLYDYRCRACSKVTEVRHGFREVHEGACPECGGEMARVFNPAGIVFKGSGFYVNDSRKPSAGSESASGGSASSKGESSSDASPSSGGSTASTASPAPASTGSSSSTNSSSGDSSSKKSESSAA